MRRIHWQVGRKHGRRGPGAAEVPTDSEAWRGGRYPGERPLDHDLLKHTDIIVHSHAPQRRREGPAAGAAREVIRTVTSIRFFPWHFKPKRFLKPGLPVHGFEANLTAIATMNSPSVATEEYDATTCIHHVPGTDVLVQGLVTNPEQHNGKHGHVLSFNEGRGRYAVALDDGKTLSLKAENVASCTRSDAIKAARDFLRKTLGEGNPSPETILRDVEEAFGLKMSPKLSPEQALVMIAEILPGFSLPRRCRSIMNARVAA